MKITSSDKIAMLVMALIAFITQSFCLGIVIYYRKHKVRYGGCMREAWLKRRPCENGYTQRRQPSRTVDLLSGDDLQLVQVYCVHDLDGHYCQHRLFLSRSTNGCWMRAFQLASVSPSNTHVLVSQGLLPRKHSSALPYLSPTTFHLYDGHDTSPSPCRWSLAEAHSSPRCSEYGLF